MTITRKSLKDISWDVPEEIYRADNALSYSTLSRFKKLGFSGLSHLFDKVDTPSLTFGSAVDSIITGGKEEFESRFMVAEFPSIPDSIIIILKDLFYTGSPTLEAISDDIIIKVTEKFNYQNNWKPETRVKVIREKGSVYYKLLHLSRDKTILSTATYNDVVNTVRALKDSLTTSWYFAKDNPFDNVERCYQLKFKATLNNVNYRIMADLLVVDHENKVIIPVDLKTSSKPEWEFYKSFVEWNYAIQAMLYYRVIRANLDKDDYFKDFKLCPYRFIVVNKNTLTPLIWECDFTKEEGLVSINGIEFEDPETLGQELNYYLQTAPTVPKGIRLDVNSITDWLYK